MRTKVTAALSLAGVLLAGSAAALVNSQVLQSSSPETGSGTVQVLSPSPTAADTTAAPVDGTVAVPSAATQATYQIGAAGTVVLDTAGDQLTVVSTTPSSGWLVVGVEQPDPLHVEVQLQSNTTVVTFRASLLFGVVSTSVESSAGTVPAGSVPTGSVPSGSVPPVATPPATTPSGGTTSGTTGTSGGSSGTVTTVDDEDEPEDSEVEDEEEDD